jgi:hypothetical protein
MTPNRLVARLSPRKLLNGIPLFDAAKAHRTDSKARDVTKVSNKSDPCEQTFNMSNVVSDREGKRLITNGLDMEQFKAKVTVKASQNPQATAMTQVHRTCLGNDCNLVPLKPSVRRRSSSEPFLLASVPVSVSSKYTGSYDNCEGGSVTSRIRD